MNLKTQYLGLELKHPLVASASPQSKTLDGIKRLEDAGAAAVVLFSLFEEQIRYEKEPFDFLMGRGTDSFSESLEYFPKESDFPVRPGDYLELIRRASEATDIPIIASLNGISNTGWTRYAGDMQEAGAKAIELNVFYIPADIHVTGLHVEERYVELVRSLRKETTLPIAVKLGPYFSSMGNIALRMEDAGANGLVFFNRFYQPDFDLDEFEIVPNLELSTSHEIRLPLLWIAILHRHLKCSLAATGGVESAREAIKYVMAGADAVMTTSALLRHGEAYMQRMVDQFSQYMEKSGYASVCDMKGCLSQISAADPSAFERANYLKALQQYAPAQA